MLRAIGEREIRPLGSTTVKKVNFKLITATNENLIDKVKKGEFREDLYQRISEYTVHLAPLSERPDEIPELLDYFCATLPGGPYKLDPLTRHVLLNHDYANGNIRELRRILVSMSVLRLEDGTLPFSGIPAAILQHASEDKTEDRLQHKLEVAWHPGMSWMELSNHCLAAAIRKTCGCKPHSLRELAPLLGLQRSTLSRRIQDLSREGLLSKSDLARYLKHSLAEEKQREPCTC